MRRSLISLSLAAIMALGIVALAVRRKSPGPQHYVPDADTAAAIAEAVLSPAYGKAHVESERPFNATLNGGVWVVTGTVYCPDGLPPAGKAPTGRAQTETVEISKSDAHIVSMTYISATVCK